MSAIKKRNPASRPKQSSANKWVARLVEQAKEDSNSILEIILLGLAKQGELQKLANKYPDEMIDILKSRLDMFVQEYISILKITGAHHPTSNNQLGGVLVEIGKRELGILLSEPKRFQDKFKKNMFATINNAKKGHELSIFKLVEWDKAWLAAPFMQEVIIFKQECFDEGFFESLALATEKKKTGVSPRKSKNKELFLHIKLLGLIHNLKARGILKKLHAGLIDDGYIPEDDPLLDFAIFKKYLTRDKIL